MTHSVLGALSQSLRMVANGLDLPRDQCKTSFFASVNEVIKATLANKYECSFLPTYGGFLTATNRYSIVSLLSLPMISKILINYFPLRKIVQTFGYEDSYATNLTQVFLRLYNVGSSVHQWARAGTVLSEITGDKRYVYMCALGPIIVPLLYKIKASLLGWRLDFQFSSGRSFRLDQQDSSKTHLEFEELQQDCEYSKRVYDKAIRREYDHIAGAINVVAGLAFLCTRQLNLTGLSNLYNDMFKHVLPLEPINDSS